MPESATLDTRQEQGAAPKEPAGGIPAARIALPANTRWTKLQTVSSQLEEIALQLGPKTKLPRVSDLCVQLNASITTVNAALGDLETRGILQRRPGVGIFVAPDLHRANILLLCNSGLLSRSDLSPFWAMLIQSAQARAHNDALGFDLQFAEPTFGVRRSSMPAVSESVTRLIETNRVNGALAVGLAEGTIAYLQQRGIPVVAFAGPANHTVQQDFMGLIHSGVRALADAGARRIALWSPLQTYCPRSDSNHYIAARYEAFRSALADAALPFDESLVRQNEYRAPEPDSSTEVPFARQGYETAMDVFANPGGTELPDAILSTDDMMTAGALSALRRCDVQVGEATGNGTRSVLIATHANAGSPVLIGYEDALILLEMDTAAVVEALFADLETLMAGKELPGDRTLVQCSVKLPRGAE